VVKSKPSAGGEGGDRSNLQTSARWSLEEERESGLERKTESGRGVFKGEMAKKRGKKRGKSASQRREKNASKRRSEG